MLRYVADENFSNTIVRGLSRREPAIDVVRVQDVGLRTRSDPDILEWAGRENRVVLTHDRDTISAAAWQRVRQGEPMPGVIIVGTHLAIGRVIDDLVMIAFCVSPEAARDQVQHLPLK